MNKEDPYKDINIHGMKVIPITKEQQQDIRKGMTAYQFQEKYPHTALKWFFIAESHIRNEKEPNPFLRATLNHYMDAIFDFKNIKEASEMDEKTKKMIEEENEPSK